MLSKNRRSRSGRGEKSYKNSDEINNSKESSLFNEELLQVQRNLLDWIIASSVFLAASIIIKGFDQHSMYFSMLFLGITAVLFSLGALTYMKERQNLRRAGIIMPYRFNVLLVILVIVVIACLYLIYDTYVGGISKLSKS